MLKVQFWWPSVQSGASQRDSQRGSTEWARDAAQFAAEASAAMGNGSSKVDSISSLQIPGTGWSSDSASAGGEAHGRPGAVSQAPAQSFNEEQPLGQVIRVCPPTLQSKRQRAEVTDCSRS